MQFYSADPEGTAVKTDSLRADANRSGSCALNRRVAQRGLVAAQTRHTRLHRLQ